MDDVFQILIYAFILISLISSFLKKKKTVNQQKVTEQNKVADPFTASEEVKQVESFDNDLMKEFEKFFKIEQPKEPQPKPEEKVQFVEPKRKTRFEDQSRKRVDEKSFHQPTESEHEYTTIWDRKTAETKRRISKVDRSIEEQAAKFEKQLGSHSTAASQISKNVRTRLRNPSSLKEYVIISEIMRKPKAFE